MVSSMICWYWKYATKIFNVGAALARAFPWETSRSKWAFSLIEMIIVSKQNVTFIWWKCETEFTLFYYPTFYLPHLWKQLMNVVSFSSIQCHFGDIRVLFVDKHILFIDSLSQKLSGDSLGCLIHSTFTFSGGDDYNVLLFALILCAFQLLMSFHFRIASGAAIVFYTGKWYRRAVMS